MQRPGLVMQNAGCSLWKEGHLDECCGGARFSRCGAGLFS
jgi:hypothetical protein